MQVQVHLLVDDFNGFGPQMLRMQGIGNTTSLHAADARKIAGDFVKMQTSPARNWKAQAAAITNSIPIYESGVTAFVLVRLRIIFHPDLFGGELSLIHI